MVKKGRRAWPGLSWPNGFSPPSSPGLVRDRGKTPSEGTKERQLAHRFSKLFREKKGTIQNQKQMKTKTESHHPNQHQKVTESSPPSFLRHPHPPASSSPTLDPPLGRSPLRSPSLRSPRSCLAEFDANANGERFGGDGPGSVRWRDGLPSRDGRTSQRTKCFGSSGWLMDTPDGVFSNHHFFLEPVFGRSKDEVLDA